MHVAVMAPVSGVPEEGFALMLIHSVFKYYYHISDTVYIFGCLSQFRLFTICRHGHHNNERSLSKI